NLSRPLKFQAPVVILNGDRDMSRIIGNHRSNKNNQWNGREQGKRAYRKMTQRVHRSDFRVSVPVIQKRDIAGPKKQAWLTAAAIFDECVLMMLPNKTLR